MTQPITTRVGEIFAITLDTMTSAGFSWTLTATEGAQVVELIDSAWRGVDAEKVGESTQQVFRFRSTGTGEAQVVFEYRRSWEAASRDTRTFDVLVQ